jgi:hypothetical protein
MIVCGEILEELGIHLNSAKVENHFHIADSIQIDDATKRSKQSLDAKYKHADLQNIVPDIIHLFINEQHTLHAILNKHKSLFDNSSGSWKNEQ